MRVTRVFRRSSAPVSATVFSGTWSQVKSGSVHSFFDSAGRVYGSSESALRMPMVPAVSRSRMPRAAASATIPPPMIR